MTTITTIVTMEVDDREQDLATGEDPEEIDEDQGPDTSTTNTKRFEKWKFSPADAGDEYPLVPRNIT